jgi:hypothetical protein
MPFFANSPKIFGLYEPQKFLQTSKTSIWQQSHKEEYACKATQETAAADNP